MAHFTGVSEWSTRCTFLVGSYWCDNHRERLEDTHAGRWEHVKKRERRLTWSSCGGGGGDDHHHGHMNDADDDE